MKNLSQFKEWAVVGAVFTAYWPSVDRDQTRPIEHRQSNAIRFEGGSWFWFPPVKGLEFRDNCMIIFNDPVKTSGHPENCKTPNPVYALGESIPEHIKNYCQEVLITGRANEERAIANRHAEIQAMINRGEFYVSR